MIYYIYDGTFNGLLSTIYDTFYSNDDPDRILKESCYQKNLFAETRDVETDPDKADKVSQAIRTKISKEAFRNIYYAFLSESKDIELYIYRYLQKGFRAGPGLNKDLTDEDVSQIKNKSRKVGREKHRLLGLLRFRQLEDGILYAPFTPEYDTSVLIAPHFAKRMPNEKWVIHDKTRDKAILYNKEEWMVVEIDQLPEITYSKDERDYQSLWKNFFDSIAIKNRKNPKLQANNMPKKYWGFLIEKDQTEDGSGRLK